MNVRLVLFVVAISASETFGNFGSTEHCRFYPPEVEECLTDAKFHPGNLQTAHDACLRNFYKNTWADNNMTMIDREFFYLRVRTRYGYGPPPTGYRIRREYRRLNDHERYNLHAAFHILYKRGIVGHFARLHATALPRIQDGAAFLPWHRVFLADFEEELRRVNPSVSLPYWDFTLDGMMPNPALSVVWTPCFFGNGNGSLVTGPFAGWHGAAHGTIKRKCNKNGRLFNKLDIGNILGMCHYANITSPPTMGKTNLETMAIGMLEWIGSDSKDIPLSAFDPTFYMTLAFIDNVWEMFRRHQMKSCGVNPENDYRPDFDAGPKGHRALDVMLGYEHLRNRHGLMNSWTKFYYNYEDQPQCPDCGSPYLFCDKTIDPKGLPEGLCVSKTYEACPMMKKVKPGRIPPGYPGVINLHHHHWAPKTFISKHSLPAVHIWHPIKIGHL